jgi:hypothetical protein
MRTIVLVAGLILSVVTPAAFAQDADGQADSFDTLSRSLNIGQKVKVSSDRDRATVGTLVSVSADQLVVSRKPWFRRPVERTFTRDSVRQIDRVDSAWNGALLGGAAAVGFTAASCAVGCASDEQGLYWALGLYVYVPAGILLGGLIDSLVTESVYKRPAAAHRIVVVPTVTRGQRAIAAQIRF